MKNKIDYKILLDFSAGKYSYNDYLRVKDWFAHAKDDKEAEHQLFDQWKTFADATATDTDSLHVLFEKIQYRILLEEKRKEKRRSFWYYYRQSAAVLIPLIALSVVFYFLTQPVHPLTQSWIEINAPAGARIEFLLPDSTSGWLNSGAKLKYPSAFGTHRKVELKGEAFFSVRHRKHSDFTVNVADLDIIVLGTQFDVSAYPNETVTEVVLKEGEVKIKSKTEGFSHMLRPGEKLSYDRQTKLIHLRKVDPNLYTAWKDGYLVIDNEPLGQAVKKIERWYNARISIHDETLKNFRFKATFSDEPLEEVLRFIAMTTPITWRIAKRDFDSNGIVKKRQVTIKLK